jgi:hypothetical protein
MVFRNAGVVKTPHVVLVNGNLQLVHLLQELSPSAKTRHAKIEPGAIKVAGKIQDLALGATNRKYGDELKQPNAIRRHGSASPRGSGD